MTVFRLRLLLLATTWALSACGTEVIMQNAQGQQVACKSGSASTGVASRRVQDDLLTECVDQYRFQGYEIASVKK